jgi:hypothetical protein
MTSPPFLPAAGRLQAGHVCVGSLVSGWSLTRFVSLSRCKSRTVRSRLRYLLCVAAGIESKMKGWLCLSRVAYRPLPRQQSREVQK